SSGERRRHGAARGSGCGAPSYVNAPTRRARAFDRLRDRRPKSGSARVRRHSVPGDCVPVTPFGPALRFRGRGGGSASTRPAQGGTDMTRLTIALAAGALLYSAPDAGAQKRKYFDCDLHLVSAKGVPNDDRHKYEVHGLCRETDDEGQVLREAWVKS